MFCRSLFVLCPFFLAVVLSVLLRLMDSDYHLVSSNSCYINVCVCVCVIKLTHMLHYKCVCVCVIKLTNMLHYKCVCVKLSLLSCYIINVCVCVIKLTHMLHYKCVCVCN